jgi:hypothetical protein
MMMILTFVAVLIILGPDLNYSVAFTAQMNQQFLTTDPEGFDPPMNKQTVMLYNITELRDYVNNTVSNYFYFSDDDNLDFFYPKTDADGFVEPIVMVAHLYDTQ